MLPGELTFLFPRFLDLSVACLAPLWDERGRVGAEHRVAAFVGQCYKHWALSQAEVCARGFLDYSWT